MPDGSKRHETELIADRGIEFLKSQSENDQPFCLNLWFNAGHAEDNDHVRYGPLSWPKAMDGKYDDFEIPEPRLSDPAIWEAHPEFLKTESPRAYHWRWDTPEKQINMRPYFRMLSGIDRAMARVLGFSKKRG